MPVPNEMYVLQDQVFKLIDYQFVHHHQQLRNCL